MAHALSNRKTGQVITMADGNALIAAGQQEDAAMFYVKRENPWHSLGKPVDNFLTAQEGLVAAGLDYEVKFGKLYDQDGKEIKIKGQPLKLIYRADTLAHLGTAGKKYNIIQNVEGFRILDHIIGDDTAKFDTAGALYDGQVVWMNAKLANNIKIAGDEIEMYFVCTNTHDGSGKLRLTMTPIRVVCQNTLNMAFARGRKGDNTRSYSISHTASWEQQVEEAKKMFAFTQDYAPKFESVANKLVKAKRTDAQFEALMTKLIGEQPGDDASKRVANRWESEREALIAELHAPDLANVYTTAWGHYNAVTAWADHTGFQRGDFKAENALLKTFVRTTDKDDALQYLLDDLKIKV